MYYGGRSAEHICVIQRSAFCGQGGGVVRNSLLILQNGSGEENNLAGSEKTGGSDTCFFDNI